MMFSDERGLMLFANCIPVLGASRGAIIDLQRSEIVLCPISMIKLFDANGRMQIEAMTATAENLAVFNEYCELLLKNELAFPYEDGDDSKFPRISLEWDFPALISHCILDLGIDSKMDIQNFLDVELRAIGCKYLQVRLYFEPETEFLHLIASNIDRSVLKGWELVIGTSSKSRKLEPSLIELVKASRTLRNISLGNYGKDCIIYEAIENSAVIFGFSDNLISEKSCGCISPGYFATNIETFTEAQLHNTCLNRKISIDVNGDIKNCPSMAKSYGNIRDTKLIDVANNPEFQKVWHIDKDQVQVCRDCEFRYICTDCRAYLEDPEDMYSKTLKCGYNPYTCEWEEWSTNPLKQKAIDFYDMRELVQRP